MKIIRKKNLKINLGSSEMKSPSSKPFQSSFNFLRILNFLGI
jgi:hypothetical protein